MHLVKEGRVLEEALTQDLDFDRYLLLGKTEKRIVNGLVQDGVGRTYAQIAQETGIPKQTIKNKMAVIREVLDVNNKFQAQVFMHFLPEEIIQGGVQLEDTVA